MLATKSFLASSAHTKGRTTSNSISRCLLISSTASNPTPSSSALIKRFNSTATTTTSDPKDSSSSSTTSLLATRFPKIHSRYQQARDSKPGKASSWIWQRKRRIALTAISTLFFLSYATMKYDAVLRDFITDDTYLVWRIHDGSIVESKTAPSIQRFLSPQTSGEDPPRVMELFEVLRTLKWASQDPRIKGIFADFGSLHQPSSVTGSPLGLAQVEELVQAIHEFNLAKREQLGGDGDSSNSKCIRPSIAWADSFSSQSQFMLASAFEELYLQPSGSIPLTGLSTSIPFFKNLLGWLGVKVYAEARREYKSMISTFTQSESLPKEQLKNEAELIGELNRGLCHAIGVSRYPELKPEEAVEKIVALSQKGPIPASEAVREGLITGMAFKRDVLKGLREGNEREKKLKEGEEVEKKIVDGEKKEETKDALTLSLEKEKSGRDFKSFDHYSRINSSHLERTLKDDEKLEVGVVYLLGSISSAPGEFSASSVVKGLREAGEDEDIKSIILRIDSGGGDVVASESIWDAVKRVREEYGKPVIASFGNACASGGYYAAAACDDIVSCENTITGSIGVASLRPTFTKKFFDRFFVNVQSFFTGSQASSSLHDLDDQQIQRQKENIDEMYSEFLKKVCDGRGISPDVIEELAGGRVFTGLRAYVLCNQDQEVDVSSTPSTPATAASEDETSSEKQAVVPQKVKLGSLTGEWFTKDVTKTGQMSTMTIEAEQKKPSTPTTSVSSPSEEALAEGSIAQEGSSLVEKVSETLEAVAATSSTESEAENDSLLAAQAHEVAEESHEPLAIKTEDESPPLGPYGRGLIGSIGGLYDAALLAMNLALNKEIAELVQDGMTLEQAMQSIRPKAGREINEGSIALASDLRLKRFPEEKTFFKRIKELNRRDEMPQMNSSPLSVGLSMISNTISLSIDEISKRVASAISGSMLKLLMNDPVRSLEDLSRSRVGIELGLDGRTRAEYRSGNIR